MFLLMMITLDKINHCFVNKTTMKATVIGGGVTMVVHHYHIAGSASFQWINQKGNGGSSNSGDGDGDGDRVRGNMIVNIKSSCTL